MTTSLLLFVPVTSKLIPTTILSDDGDYILSLPKGFRPQHPPSTSPRVIVRSNNYATGWISDNWHRPQRICVVGDRTRLLTHVEELGTRLPRHANYFLTIPKTLEIAPESSVLVQVEQDEQCLPGFSSPHIVVLHRQTLLRHAL